MDYSICTNCGPLGLRRNHLYSICEFCGGYVGVLYCDECDRRCIMCNKEKEIIDFYDKKIYSLIWIWII